MYRLAANPLLVIRLADGAEIPANAGNPDYAAYLAWKGEGNTPEPVPARTAEELEAEKLDLLAIGRANREIILNRLNGHRDDVEDDIAAALAANDAEAIALARANLAAIKVCRASLKEMFSDPRVVAAVDGEVKAAVTEVYGEIATALFLSAPSVFIAFKGLDEL